MIQYSSVVAALVVFLSFLRDLPSDRPVPAEPSREAALSATREPEKPTPHCHPGRSAARSGAAKYKCHPGSERSELSGTHVSLRARDIWVPALASLGRMTSEL